MEYPFYLNGKFWQACKVSDKTNAVVVNSGCGLTFHRRKCGDISQDYIEVFACESPYCAVNSVGEIEPVPCEPRDARLKRLLFEGWDFMTMKTTLDDVNDLRDEVLYVKRFLVEKFGE